MKTTLLILFFIINPLKISRSFVNEGFDYSSLECLEWKKIMKHNIIIEVKDISYILYKEIVSNMTMITEIFTENEKWIVKKYDKNNLIEPTIDEDGIPGVFLNGEIIVPSIDVFSIEKDKYIALIYDIKKRWLIVSAKIQLYIYDYITNQRKSLVEYSNYLQPYSRTTRMIKLENEYLYTIGWINGGWRYPDFAYMKIYRYNLIKKEVAIFDSYTLGILVPPIDEIEGFYPMYDISMDKRFVYIPALHKDGYTDPEAFRREKVKINGGLYVYDWETDRIFKLADGSVSAVTNNTDDGYVYYRTETYVNKKIKYDYFRFKNPEDLLKSMK